MTEEDLTAEEMRDVLRRNAVLDAVREGASSVAALSQRVDMTQMAFATALHRAFQGGFLTQWGNGIAFTEKGRAWAKKKEEFTARVRASLARDRELYARLDAVVGWEEPKTYKLRKLFTEVGARGAAIRVFDQPVDEYLGTLKSRGDIEGFGYNKGRHFLWVSREADAHSYPRAINTTPVGIVRNFLPSLASLSV